VSARITTIDSKEVCRLFTKEKLPAWKIGKMFNVSITPIYRVLKEMGVNTGSLKHRAWYTVGWITKTQLENLYHNEKLNRDGIAKRLGVSTTPIKRLFREYKIEPRPSPRDEKISKITKQLLDGYYNEQLLTFGDISKKLGISANTIRGIARNFGILARKRKYHIDENFFKAWSPESAWAFGWILGDGQVGATHKADRIRIEILRKDESVLLKIRNILKSNHPIKYRRGNMASMTFNSKRLVRNYNSLDYRKTPQAVIVDFARGFFEAEGCVYWAKNWRIKRGGAIRVVISQNDKSVLEFLHSNLLDFGIVRNGTIREQKGNHLLTYGIDDGISLYHYLYDDCGELFMPRKKERFEELIDKHLA